MQALISHYNVRRSAIVFPASCYVSLHLTMQAVRPPVERIWRKLSSDEALDLYAYCIVFACDIAILLGKLAIAAVNDYRHWADAFVESHLLPAVAAIPTPATVEPIAVAPALPVEPIIEQPIAFDATATPVKRQPQVSTTAKEVKATPNPNAGASARLLNDRLLKTQRGKQCYYNRTLSAEKIFHSSHWLRSWQATVTLANG